jgi:hypothetical protein
VKHDVFPGTLGTFAVHVSETLYVAYGTPASCEAVNEPLARTASFAVSITCTFTPLGHVCPVCGLHVSVKLRDADCPLTAIIEVGTLDAVKLTALPGVTYSIATTLTVPSYGTVWLVQLEHAPFTTTYHVYCEPTA